MKGADFTDKIIWREYLDYSEETADTVYRNAAALLCTDEVKKLASLCGRSFGDCTSDYEKLCRLFEILPFCRGHIAEFATFRILKAIFGMGEENPSAKAIWIKCCEEIEKQQLTPGKVFSLLGEYDGLPDCPDVKPLMRLTDKAFTLEVNSEAVKDITDYGGFTGFIRESTDRYNAAEFDFSGFRFERNTKNREISSGFTALKNGTVSKKQYDELVTSSVISLCSALTEKNKTLILRFGEKETDEAEKLFIYLVKYNILPHTVIITDSPIEYTELAARFTFDGDLPKIALSSKNPSLCRHFPISFAYDHKADK